MAAPIARAASAGPPGGAREPGYEPPILVERLRAANIFSLTVSGLHKAGDLYGPGSLSTTFNVPGGATVDQIKGIIEQAGECSPANTAWCLTSIWLGFSRPEGLVEERTMFMKVTEGNSVFDATAPNGLQISKDEPLLWWMNKYDEYHGVTTAIPMKTEVQWTRDSLKVDNLTIRCHRTLRVPDTDEASHLPPVCCLYHRDFPLRPTVFPGHGPFPSFPCVPAWFESPCGDERTRRVHHGMNHTKFWCTS